MKSTAKRKLEIIQKSWITKKELMELCDCGERRATSIINEMREAVLPKRLSHSIPTGLVIEHMYIDVKLLMEMREFESPRLLIKSSGEITRI